LSLFWTITPWIVAVAAGVLLALVWRRYRRLQSTQRESREALAQASLTLTRIRQAVEGASDAIGIGDFEGQSFYHNQAHIKLFGYTVEELNAVPGEGVLFADPTVAGEIHRSIRAGRSWTGETDIVSKDGRRIPALVRADIIRDEAGKPVGIFGVFTDITRERQRAEEAARASKLESLGMMAGSIAHDFRNLLTAMLGHLSLAQLEENLTETMKSRLEGVERAAWRAKDVTEQLTTFAKGGTPTKKRVALGPVIREAVGFAVQNSRLELRCELPENLPEVEGDEAQLVQVFNNLAVNAVQAMPGGGVLAIAAEITGGDGADRPGRWISLRVSDTGVGIPPENMARIFDPFFTTKPNGTGLGLATSYSVIRKLGGNLRVESTPGRGTTFHILLPAAPDPARPQPGNEVSRSA
jgi:PAS domain S-box-containing protein